VTDKATIQWCEAPDFYREAESQIKPAGSVLDIGCGIRPQQYIVPDVLICVEPHLEYVEVLKHNLRDAPAIIIPLEAKRVLAALPDRSVDSIFLIDVIEHMVKEDGIAVLQECQRVARQQIIIFTPLGFMPQEIHAGDVDGWNLHGGEWQDHKSGWYPEDFPDWQIIACAHLHAADYKGQPISPPYGGFYAIKNIEKTANYFNDLYARDVIQQDTHSLATLQTHFPLFVEQVVARDIEKSNLKCGIQACQRTTELFIELGATQTQAEILQQAARDKTEALLQESRRHQAKIKQFATEFADTNGREAKLAAQANSLAAQEAGLTARETALAERAALLAAHEAALQGRETEVTARESVFAVRVLRWLGRVCKIMGASR
jgi:hypothetical protein